MASRRFLYQLKENRSVVPTKSRQHLRHTGSHHRQHCASCCRNLLLLWQSHTPHWVAWWWNNSPIGQSHCCFWVSQKALVGRPRNSNRHQSPGVSCGSAHYSAIWHRDIHDVVSLTRQETWQPSSALPPSHSPHQMAGQSAEHHSPRAMWHYWHRIYTVSDSVSLVWSPGNYLHPQRASMLYFADVFNVFFFMTALVGQTAERIFTKLSHVVDIRCYLWTY